MANGQLSQEELLSPQPHPAYGKTIVCDTMECFADQDEHINRISSIGFEPYAVTTEPDTRPEVQAQARLKNMVPFRHKMWFKRVRIPKEEV